MKEQICFVFGVIGSAIAGAFGGWSAAMTTLIIFMAIDYITGIIVAGVFHKSKKSKSGSLKSIVGWKGLCKKGAELLVVLVACRLDLLLGVEYIKDCSVIAFVINEAISIFENIGLMGVPLPTVVVKAIDILTEVNNKNGGITDEATDNS